MLSENLKKARKNTPYSQQDVADYLKVKRQTYSSYERGVSIPDALTLEKLASLFECSTDFLLGLSDNKKSPSNESDLTPDEQEFLRMYNELSSDQRGIAKAFLKSINKMLERGE